MNPVKLAILKGRLEGIADEMDATLFRSAFNPIIAEAHDASHGIYDAQTGETLIQGKSGLPIFVGVMAFAVKAVIEKINMQEPAEEGDVWIFNDPYSGGTHLSDFRLVKPLFWRERIFCYIASVAHWHDIGGNVPGNYNPIATETFQEGVLIPPVKLYAKGVFQQEIVDILSANSRLPLSLYGDLNGQINALDLGTNRINSLLEEYTAATVSSCFKELKQKASKLMHAEISALPNGTVVAEDYLDNDGITDKPLIIKLALTINDSSMLMDFSGSSSACLGPLNISYSTTIAACYVALKHIFDEVPANSGVLEPISFKVDPKSLLAVSAPKPVGGYTETILRLIDVIFQAFAEIKPKEAMACAYGTINALSITGNKENGQRWVMFSFFGGGHGAHSEGDGLNHGNAPISTATIPPLEILESAYPVFFNKWALRTDSGGVGRYRGGLGAIYEIELLAENAQVFLFGERGRFPPKGIHGGKDGALNIFSYSKGIGTQFPSMTSKMVDLKLFKGETITIKTPGGGGCGNVKLRPTSEILNDIETGVVSIEGAYNDYGFKSKT